MKRGRTRIDILLILLAVVAAGVGVFLILYSLDKDGVNGITETADGRKTEIVSPIYKDISSAVFMNADGADMTLSKGKCSVLLYWASWCPNCDAMLSDASAVAEKVAAAGADFYLVDRLEPGKESIESAEKALADFGITIGTLYDSERLIYDGLGLSMIPTLVVVDKNGCVVATVPGEIPEDNMLLSMINEAQTGKAAQLRGFIKNGMTGGDGGVRTEFVSSNGGIPSGADVLSESQGLFMLCAGEDNALFELLYGYTKAHTAGGGLASWVVTDDGDSAVNAAIDDLRIVRALADKGGYDSDISEYAVSLYEYNVNNGQLVDFYDFESGKARRMTLCFADFEALDILAETDGRFSQVRKNALVTVKNGYISDEFPLYKSWFDYTRNVYPSTELNMAEAFTTLLHLSKVGELTQRSLEWIRERISEGRIWASYSENGKPASRHESTAVYGLAAMIAVSEGDMSLASAAIEKMETLKVRNSALITNGAFGAENGEGVFSFDQLTALSAYREMDSALGKNGELK